MSSSSGIDSAFLLLLSHTALSPVFALLVVAAALLWLRPGGPAWALCGTARNAAHSIPGPSGVVTALSGSAAHRALARMAASCKALGLMAFSVGCTRFVVSSKPDMAKEILNSSAFADRPIKESAYELLFHRAMGFAPFGDYWRNLRRISATYLFSPKRIAASGKNRLAIGNQMAAEINDSMEKNGAVQLKKVLHFGSLNNVMMSVFGQGFDFAKREGLELEGLVSEGYELLGLFNWSDHIPILGLLDFQGVRRRCRKLVNRVNVFVGRIIDDHRNRRIDGKALEDGVGDFVDVLLDLEKEEKLSDADMIAVLWEMIFRGTDTVAILMEWIMARMILHPDVQSKAQSEIDAVVGGISRRPITDADIPRLPYLQSIVKESLRMHPPGPLLSWARLAIHDVHVGNHLVPAGTTAMVNMWAITHDETIWPEPNEFRPERFMEEDVSILGSDLRLAPFGSGRRVCPGKAMALSTVHIWLAQLLQSYKWLPAESGVDLSECLKMSLEMEKPLVCKAVPRV